VKLWAEWLTSNDILQHGAKKLLGETDGGTQVELEDLDLIFTTQAAESLLGSMEGSVAFPALVARRHGPAGLVERPRIVVGTIHSVKGGEADAVFLFPDLSEAGHAAYQRRGATHDSVIRLFYVGATRARRSLYWCAPASGRAVNV
jgi:superfamily I DNA/RNA helicase